MEKKQATNPPSHLPKLGPNALKELWKLRSSHFLVHYSQKWNLHVSASSQRSVWLSWHQLCAALADVVLYPCSEWVEALHLYETHISSSVSNTRLFICIIPETFELYQPLNTSSVSNTLPSVSLSNAEHFIWINHTPFYMSQTHNSPVLSTTQRLGINMY